MINAKVHKINEIQVAMRLQEVVEILDMMDVKLISTKGTSIDGSFYFGINEGNNRYYIEFDNNYMVSNITTLYK
jgi:alkyl sulfatase BDS1-like metallo-beta-lactamase superfamily hydrolase